MKSSWERIYVEEPSFTIKEPSYESFEAFNAISIKYLYEKPAVWLDHLLEIFLETFAVSVECSYM